jgi:peptidoglycan/xylan/chitin deacetylase (PgdA/CDA1 family)
MKLREWFAARGPGYALARAAVLLDRYSITPSKAVNRVERCIETLADYGCAPTLPTPGRVVQRHPQFLRELQDVGAEIAVHGYDHVDLRVYPPPEASEQLVRAAQTFAHHGIEVSGFRCPYLSCTDDLLRVLPDDIFDYSSNKAIWWDVLPPIDGRNVAKNVDVLDRLYGPTSAAETVCTPWTRLSMVEIPVCLPDDLQLHDGLQLGSEGMTRARSRILRQTHTRGELFVLLFHPELARQCEQPFMAVLLEATRLKPSVWIARLRDISDWWREKASFGVVIRPAPETLHISFTCSERATILVRGLDACSSDDDWDGAYYQVRTRSLDVPHEPRPFVGLPPNAPERVVSFLREQGYILDTGETAIRCGTYIDAATLARLTNEVKLIDHIEASTGPLVRYWRWPRGAKSAICVTGDLDALTLVDYASRLLVR